MTDSSLVLYNIEKSFGRNRVLNEASLSVPTGGVCGLFGLNGAGKTTLLRIAYGLCRPDGGTVRYRGEAIDSWRMVRQSVGYAAELPWDVLGLSVSGMTRWLSGLHSSFRREKMEKLLTQAKIADEQVGALSSGQKALLSLCMALATEPEILLVDEPFANVDVENRSRFVKLLVEEANLNGKTILIASHLIGELAGIVDNIAILHGGKIKQYDDVDEFTGQVVRVTAASPFEWNGQKSDKTGSLLVAAQDVKEMQNSLNRDSVRNQIEPVTLTDAFRFAVGGGQ